MTSADGLEICSIRVTQDVAIEVLVKARALFETHQDLEPRREHRTLRGRRSLRAGPSLAEGTTPLGKVRGIAPEENVRRARRKPQGKRTKTPPAVSQRAPFGEFEVLAPERPTDGVQSGRNPAVHGGIINNTSSADDLPGPGETSATVAHVGTLATADTPGLLGIISTLGPWLIVKGFMGNYFAPVARVCTDSKAAWGNSPKRTQALTQGMSAALLTSFFEGRCHLSPSHVISNKIARWGNLELLRIAIKFQCGHMNDETCAIAAENGHLECLQLLRASKFPWKVSTLHRAACGGHIHVLNWAWEHRCPRKGEAIADCAVKGGHQAAIDWAREKRCCFSTWTFRQAALTGNLHIMKNLREHGCPFNFNACLSAAKQGHLKALVWLREQGCPWDEFVCSYAAMGGHLDVLKFARQNGCPWSSETIQLARSGNHGEVLAWARAHGCQEPPL